MSEAIYIEVIAEPRYWEDAAAGRRGVAPMNEQPEIDDLNRILPGNSLPPVPADFAGPCLIEVKPQHRSGRGRWWRPKSNGYTDIPGEAGVYSAEEAAKICVNQDRIYRVDARRVADIARRSAEKLLNAIGEVS